MSMERLWRRLVLSAQVALVLGIAVLVAWLAFIRWHPSTADYRFQGVDVSDAQGPIDWVAAHEAGADFAYLRATYGASGRDQAFAGHWQAVDAAGMKRGAYLDYSLCQPGADQADNFNTVVPHDDNALPPAVVVDFSPDCAARPDPQTVVGEIARLMAMIENHSGKPALLKVSRAFDRRYRLSGAIPRPIWVIDDFFRPGYAARPWRMWQANDRRRIAGIDRPVHWDVVGDVAP